MTDNPLLYGCTGKSPFATLEQAKKRAKRMRQDHERDCFVEAYHCLHCRQYHVGQARGREVRRAKGRAK